MINSVTIQCTHCNKKNNYITSGLAHDADPMKVECGCNSGNNTQYPFEKFFWLIAMVNAYWDWIHDDIEVVAPCSVYTPEPQPDFDPFDALHIYDLSFRFKRGCGEEDLDQVYQLVFQGKQPMSEIKGAVIIPVPPYPALLKGHRFHETSEELDRFGPLTISFLEALNALNQEFAQISGFLTGFRVCDCKVTKSLESCYVADKPR